MEKKTEGPGLACTGTTLGGESVSQGLFKCPHSPAFEQAYSLLPKGCEVIASGVIEVGDLVWGELQETWWVMEGGSDPVGKPVTEYSAVVRIPGPIRADLLTCMSQHPERPTQLLLKYCFCSGYSVLEGFLVVDKVTWDMLKQQAEELGKKVWDLNTQLETKREQVQFTLYMLYGESHCVFFRPASFFSQIEEKLITADQASTFKVLFNNGMMGPANIKLTIASYIAKLQRILAESNEAPAV